MAPEMVVGARGPRRAPTITSPGLAQRDESGAVTAEAAAVMPVLLALCVGLLWLVSLAATHVLVVDTAREVARAAARGDRLPAVAGPGGDRVAVSTRSHGRRIEVVATAAVNGPGGLFGFLPPVRLTSTAWAVPEPQ